MGDLMRRRAMMAAVSGGGDGPLYSFVNLSLRGSGSMSTFKITDGNRFYWKSTRNNYAVYFQFDNGKSGGSTYSETDPPVFSLHAGDEVYFKATSVSYKTADVANTTQVSLVKPDASILTSLTFAPSPVSSSEFADFADYTSTPVTIEEDTDVLCFRARRSAGTYNKAFEIYFNFEMYVNGVRWI